MKKSDSISRKLKGIEKKLASDTLDMMSKYGIKSIQFGSRSISKDKKEVIEIRKISMPKNKE
jgi:hypothetical protein